jgi:hypothetical protein
MRVGDPVSVVFVNYKCDLLGIEEGDIGLVSELSPNMEDPMDPWVVIIINGHEIVFKQTYLKALQ